MSFFCQFLAEFNKIIDLSIEYQPERAVFVGHRLEPVR